MHKVKVTAFYLCNRSEIGGVKSPPNINEASGVVLLDEEKVYGAGISEKSTRD
jgi:hypothetical protein